MSKVIHNDYIYTGAKLHYSVVQGTLDKPLVLIHGQGMCSLDYEKVIEKFSKNYTIWNRWNIMGSKH